MSRNKMTKDVVPENFTLGLALVDAIPVIFFGASMVVISLLFSSGLFLTGALLCLFAGIAKVLWKIIVVCNHKNIWWLFIQMRIIMPIGMVLMIISVLVNWKNIVALNLVNIILTMPSMLFFILGTVGMLLMIVFAFSLDSSDVRANWIEQITNGLAQVFFFLGLLLML